MVVPVDGPASDAGTSVGSFVGGKEVAVGSEVGGKAVGAEVGVGVGVEAGAQEASKIAINKIQIKRFISSPIRKENYTFFTVISNDYDLALRRCRLMCRAFKSSRQA